MSDPSTRHSQTDETLVGGHVKKTSATCSTAECSPTPTELFAGFSYELLVNAAVLAFYRINIRSQLSCTVSSLHTPSLGGLLDFWGRYRQGRIKAQAN